MNEIKSPKNWILIRGLIRSKFHWKNFPELLKKKLSAENVFCVELPGNGYLHRENSPVDAERAVEILRSQVPNEILAAPYGIVAISLGGMIAAAWAKKFPDEVSHLVAINTSSKASPFYKRLQPKNYLKIIKLLKGGNSNKTEEFILSVSSNREDIWRKQFKENFSFAEQHPVKIRNFVRQLKLASSANLKSKPNAECLLLASEQDRIVHVDCSREIAKQWQCPIEFHETAGHDLPLDDASWVIRRIANWLK